MSAEIIIRIIDSITSEVYQCHIPFCNGSSARLVSLASSIILSNQFCRWCFVAFFCI